MTDDAVKKVWKRRFWIIPPILIGVAAVALSPLIKSKPQEIQITERAVKVRAITVSKLAVVPRAGRCPYLC